MKIITSSQNPLIKRLTKLGKDSSFRKEEGAILLEGKKIILECLKKHPLKNILIPEEENPEELDGYHLKLSLSEKISSFKSSDGFFAEMDRPLNKDLSACQRLLVCDRIQDPGNLGTLIRSALAFGFDGIFILDQTVDPFSPKVIRSSMGACLNIQIQQGTYQDFAALVKKANFKVLIADAKGSPLESQSLTLPVALVLGNEGEGPQFEQYTHFKLVSIPIENVDSLNVAIAGSILMHQLKVSLCP